MQNKIPPDVFSSLFLHLGIISPDIIYLQMQNKIPEFISRCKTRYHQMSFHHCFCILWYDTTRWKDDVRQSGASGIIFSSGSVIPQDAKTVMKRHLVVSCFASGDKRLFYIWCKDVRQSTKIPPDEKTVLHLVQRCLFIWWYLGRLSYIFAPDVKQSYISR